MTTINRYLSKRKHCAEKINNCIQDVPSENAKKILLCKGYPKEECEHWGYYIFDSAFEYDVPYKAAVRVFMKLGPDEAFDKFLVELDKYYLDDFSRALDYEYES